MPDSNPATPAAASPPANPQGQPATPAGAAVTPEQLKDIQSQVASLTQSVQVLSGKARTYEQVLKEAGDSVTWENGVPKWNGAGPGNGQATPTYPAQQPGGYQQQPGGGFQPPSNPFVGLVDDPGSVDKYTQQLVGQYVQSQGFITPQQLEEAKKQAAQEGAKYALSFVQTQHVVDSVLSAKDKDGKLVNQELSSMDSNLSKKTKEVLLRNGWVQPFQSSDGQPSSWSAYENQYADPKALPVAVQIAKAELHEQGQAAQAGDSQAAQAAAAAGMVSGDGSSPGAGAPTGGDWQERIDKGEDLGSLIDAGMAQAQGQ